MTNYTNPTTETYEALTRAFDFFNERLFVGRLPEVLITLQRKRKAHGYFWAEQFVDRRVPDARVDEIALNPETCGREEKLVLSTLVHEMVHLRQQHEGTPGKRGHHNKEWGEMMDEIGLIPSSTAAPGGKRTGRSVSHYIDEGGPFDVACDELLASGFELPWFTQAPPPAAKKKDPSKVKHSCPSCGLNAWAKEGARMTCGDCEEPLIAS